jgi:hypothetical protein
MTTARTRASSRGAYFRARLRAESRTLQVEQNGFPSSPVIPTPAGWRWPKMEFAGASRRWRTHAFWHHRKGRQARVADRHPARSRQQFFADAAIGRDNKLTRASPASAYQPLTAASRCPGSPSGRKAMLDHLISKEENITTVGGLAGSPRELERAAALQ